MKKYQNLFSVEGKKAMVIGGGSGIGQAIAEGLADLGAEVMIASRTLSNLEAAAAEIYANTGKTIRYYQLDVTNEDEIISLAKRVQEEIGTIDILVNSMGYNKKFHTLDNETELWDATYQTNVRGLMLCCREFGRAMVEQRWGRIINIGSIGAYTFSTSGVSGAYSSSKGAVWNFTRCLALEWAKYNVTVNQVSPILTGTRMMNEILQKDPQHLKDVEASNPMGRIGQPEDCVGLVAFFASEAAGFVTGQNLLPDGGQACL